MIKQQLRPNGILNDRILSLFDEIPRESFVPHEYQAIAYADYMIPITKDQVMLSPVLEAKILNELNIQPNEKVLEVGTGAGYLTALLAKQAYHVYSVDYHDQYTQHIRENLSELDIGNVSLQLGNATQGWPKQQPYDVIVITGSLDFLPTQFKEQLTVGGRLFVVIDSGPAMHAHLIKRNSEQTWQDDILFETAIPPFSQALRKSKFEF